MLLPRRWVALAAIGWAGCSGSSEDAPLEDTDVDSGAVDGDTGLGEVGTGDGGGDSKGDTTPPVPDTKPPDPPPIPGAVYGAKCSDMTANELVAWQEIAIVRGKAKMGALDCVDSIQKAARSHSTYIQLNGGGLTHTQTAGKPGFTGVQFWDRMKAAGFTGSAMFEVVHSTPDAHAAILGEGGWINTLYHRIPFVAFGAKSYGFGAAPFASTIDFASGAPKPAAGTVSTWPVDGDKDVWSTFRCGSEVPNPLPGQTFAGYPVSLTAAGALSVTEHVITTAAGAAVDHVMLTKGTDSTGLIPVEMVFLIPKAPLAKSTAYTTKISGTNGGAAFTKTWGFTTGAK